MEYVLHQAAIPSVPRSVNDPITSNRANVDASLNVLVAARDAGVKRLGLRRIVVGVRQHADAAQARGHAAQPAVALRAAEAGGGAVLPDVHAALRLRDGHDPVFQRLRAAAGSRSSPYSGVISLFSTALLEGRQPTIYGDGEQTRDFTYVANVVDGVLRACEAKGVAGEVINVATGGRISLNELLRVMNGIIGTSIQPIYAEPRAGDVKDSQADISKAEQLLGYRPTVSLEEGLTHTLDWCRSERATAAGRSVNFH